MSIGMSYGQFYDGHAWLTVPYKKAYRLRRQQFDNDAYLIGSYVYEAVARSMHDALLDKKKDEPVGWLKKPFKTTFSRDQGQKMDAEEDRAAEGEAPKAAVAYMQDFMLRFNRGHAMDGKPNEKQPT